MTAAHLPPTDLPGLDPAWSRLVDLPGRGTMHVLERPAQGTPEVTVLAVHGNPTWSYLWRRLLAEAPPTWRIIAVDHLGMGFSSRGEPRRLADRVADLGALTDALDVAGPVVTVAHDWGGPISLGWVLEHRDLVVGVVLTNTAVHQPEGARTPGLIRLARSRALLPWVTRGSRAFVRGTTALSRQLPRDVIDAYAAPYTSAEDRAAVMDFVADIPLEVDHPSAPTLDGIAEGVTQLADVPVFLAWGADDPVFSDRYLRDLVARMPHADVHRYEGARHLVTEDDARCIPDIITWISRLREGRRSSVQSVGADLPDMNAGLRQRAEDASVALADMRSDLRVSWQRLAGRTNEIARGLVAWGVAPGDRVALLVTPGPDLIASVYAAWSIGAVVVVADSGLGLRGMRRALRSAEPTHVIGIPAGLGLARTLEIPGRRFLVGRPGAAARLLGADATLSEVARRGREEVGVVMPQTPDASADALVAFTSGATGPAKGVVYTQGRLRALREALRSAYDITESDALVAAFAPWAVLGPALGIASAIPDMDLTDASTLTSVSFAEATAAVGGTLMWASPTGLRGIVSTTDFLTADQRASLQTLREILVAGAPVPVELLAQAAALVPTARCSTPYGMTEALPLTATDLAELSAAEGAGVLVGRPLDGVDVAIAPLASDGTSADDTTTDAGIAGEIVVRAPWMRDRYDRRWGVQDRADTPRGWHRTGDVGHLDDQGRLWVEGRLAHVITTVDGPVTPVGIELAAQRAAEADLSACVGVGPAGTQAVAVVLQRPGPALGTADVDLTMRVREAVRAATGVDVAAVLTMREIPVDVRHRSKVDRARVADDVANLLAGDGDDG